MNERENVTVNTKYKDSLFRKLFSEPKELLSLYNAVNKTHYEDETKLEINTIDTALFLWMRNDVSFIFDFKMNVYEHQATVNPNMPLRDLIYVSELYKKYLNIEELDYFSSKKLSIPAPRFVVFYNGVANQPDMVEMKLSDLFECKSDMLELKVIQYNVNAGHNSELLGVCKTLGEYAEFVSEVRKLSQIMSIEEAIPLAVKNCIAKGILTKFLIENEAEVSTSVMFEYIERVHDKTLRDEGIEIGLEIGRTEGISAFIKALKDLKIPADKITEELKNKFNLDEEKIKEYMDKYY